MCGIAGFIDRSVANYNPSIVAKRMGEAINTRGPDSKGYWCDSALGVNLIHRRLAILDLSDAGHQPMISHNGKYVITFNGEIYNFKQIVVELESKLGKIKWRGHSDTEVLLLAFETFGIQVTLSKMEGMFALALWDRVAKKLILIRDRMGEKPLYFGYFNGVFGFSSELKALNSHPKFDQTINHNAIGQLMLHNCIPAPLSIYNGISKLMPGHLIEFTYEDLINCKTVDSIAYWKLADNLIINNNYNDINQVSDHLEFLLNNVIKDQMVADVPLGCFLSGGIDSSLIAALMQKQSSTSIKTFSIGFDVPAYNEAEYAKAVALHLKTDHTELYVTEQDALNIVPQLAKIYDEPFSDSSQLPTYLLCQLAKQQVTVSLSGDGGDELFLGYSRYNISSKLYNKINKIPRVLFNLLLKLANPNILKMLNRITKFPINNYSNKIDKLKKLVYAKNYTEFYLFLSSHWHDFDQIINDLELTTDYWNKVIDQKLSYASLMQYIDALGYLPDDILVKVDRAAMANSLETRIPLLNHKIVEFAFALPDKYKHFAGHSKYPLRKILYKYVPHRLIERPKKGFGIPIHNWLRGALKDWCYDLLDKQKLKQQGYFNSEMVYKKLNDHMSGDGNYGYYLWDILMFQQWLENQTQHNI